MKMRHVRKYVQKKFTLLELLIVIAIITILASLLMPALSRAKAITRKTQCSSNIRQIELGAISYYGDTGGYHAAYWTSANGACWSGAGYVLNDYLSDSTPYSGAVLKSGIRSKYACPDVNVDSAVDTRTVGINTHSFGAANTLTKPGMAPNLKRWLNGSKIKNPSAVCHFADANGAAMNSAAIVYRHQNSANVSYLDGHCGSARLYPTSVIYDTTQAYNIFWGMDASLYP